MTLKIWRFAFLDGGKYFSTSLEKRIRPSLSLFLMAVNGNDGSNFCDEAAFGSIMAAKTGGS